MKALSKTAAHKRAIHEIRMYREGRGWIINSWDPGARADRLSHQINFWQARVQRRFMVFARTYELMGFSQDEALTMAERDLAHFASRYI